MLAGVSCRTTRRIDSTNADIRLRNYLGQFFTTLILLHALITGPLLVLCMPGDGECLIEFVGHDPCHHFKAIKTGGDASTSLASEEDADTCVDLMLDNTGATQAGIDPVSLPFAPVTPELADFCDCGWSFIHGQEIYRLPREPVILPLCTPHSDLSLRI